jgi:nucleolysin TIA-1/TIAR
MQADRGFAFVKLDSHENAAMAIVQLQGQLVHGRPVKCSWGKDRMSTGQDGGQPGGGMGGQQPGGQMPQYGMVSQDSLVMWPVSRFDGSCADPFASLSFVPASCHVRHAP